VAAFFLAADLDALACRQKKSKKTVPSQKLVDGPGQGA
jgi:hypothetical protein